MRTRKSRFDDAAKCEVVSLREKEGLSAKEIHRRTGIGASSVRTILHDAGIKLTCGGQPLPRKKREAIDDDLRNRRDFLCRIAKKHGVGVETVRRRKKQILGAAPLLSTWPPLQSKFAQADAAELVPTAQEYFLAIVRKCVDLAGEKLIRQGRNRADVIAAKRFLKHNPQPVLDKFEAGLRQAVTTFRFETMAVEDTVH